METESLPLEIVIPSAIAILSIFLNIRQWKKLDRRRLADRKLETQKKLIKERREKVLEFWEAFKAELCPIPVPAILPEPDIHSLCARYQTLIIQYGSDEQKRLFNALHGTPPSDYKTLVKILNEFWLTIFPHLPSHA